MENLEIPLSDDEFVAIKQRVYRIAGISLSDAKRTLVISRLTKVVRGLGLRSFSDYVDFLDRGADADQVQTFVNALTTNLTRFYREEHHFAHLVDYVGTLIENPPRRGAGGKPRLRIWSAGCSTGQEPYTIALALMDAYPQLKRWDFRILATDIDTNVLKTASAGIYKKTDLAGLSAQRMAFFEKAGPDTVAIPRAIRELIAFKPLNLITEWPFKGPFDVIFCRNVVIYFDRPTQEKLFERMASVLSPSGFLYIGHSENLNSVNSRFDRVGKTIYRPKSAMGRSAA